MMEMMLMRWKQTTMELPKLKMELKLQGWIWKMRLRALGASKVLRPRGRRLEA
jgi:hypothetical protein